MQNKLKIMLVASVVSAAAIVCRLALVYSDGSVISAVAGRGSYRVAQKSEYASIYDCNGRRLNNCSYELYALINPHDAEALKIKPYVSDMQTYNSGISGNLPFLCMVTEECGGVTFRKAVRTGENQLARHLVGYTSDNVGVCGIERAYDGLLRDNYSENYALFSVDAVGGVLEGLYSEIGYAQEVKAGVVTTLDADIQRICEEEFRRSDCEKGAVVVMDVKTGEIRACASFPEYEINNLAAGLNDVKSPFMNRAFSPYGVGSIFKLVTAAAALERGISPEFTYDCMGQINVNGQLFNCHKWGGHGEICMNDAMVQSCNPYFIALSEYIGLDSYLETAAGLGFGEGAVLADGITAAEGYLPTEKELSVAAERGNFAFGQGKLSATPLQICRMTAAIANNGVINEPTLISGTRDENGVYTEIPHENGKRVLSYLTAHRLREFMVNTVNGENSMSRSELVTSGGKTSTAQTGRFFADGTEKLNCWFTGYFPSSQPKYAITVLAEEKRSGNSAAAPIYRAIAEKIAKKDAQSKD